MRPLLFDLQSDPNELHDLGGDPTYASEINRLREWHFDWTRRHHARMTRSPAQVERMSAAREPPGIYIAYRDREELEADGLTMPAPAQA